MNLAPNIYRPGVICGFALGLVAGLTPSLSVGVLLAQGTIWQPATPPAVPAAPASARQYLAYNSTAGLYWTSNQAGDNAGDAVLGWVRTSSSTLLVVSNQVIATSASQTGSGGSGGGGGTYVSDSEPAASLLCQEVPIGTLDGVNAVFHLVSAPADNSLVLALNGIVQDPGVDFSLNVNAM